MMTSLNITVPSACFRGSIAPASLKLPHGAGCRPGTTGVFPGLYCPGLIEAGQPWVYDLLCEWCFRGSIAPASLKLHRDRRARAIEKRVSGALLPRPH